MFAMVMAHVSAIACGHKEAIDLDRLRHDPLRKVAVGRCPITSSPLTSQSTISRLENAPSRTEAARLTAALVDQAGMTVKPRREEILDIDDTFCAAHGGPQLAFWDAHHDEHGLRVDAHLSCGERHAGCGDPAPGAHSEGLGDEDRHQACDEAAEEDIGRRLASSGVAISHYGRDEAVEWAENNADYIFGLVSNTALNALVAETADNLPFDHAMSSKPKLRTFASFT